MSFTETTRARDVGRQTAGIGAGAAVVIIVSFEGPDPYSQAGGLGVRVTGLVETLADLDYESHLFFIGDPVLPGEEHARDGRLVLHRWAQWISANCPAGVYDGEAGKVADVTASLPLYLVERLILPAIAVGRIPIVLFEEWQTAECACRLSDTLAALGVRDRVLLVWNANNPYGFERIDWARLASSTVVTTISWHMRSIIRSCGADARVIPNGISNSSFDPAPPADVARLRAALEARPGSGLLFKMARWEREKGWSQALDAIRHAREDRSGHEVAAQRSPILVARSGGPTGSGSELIRDAEMRGLRVLSFDTESQFTNGLAAGLRAGGDVVSLRFGVSPSLARTLYATAEGVLANSVSEPFGLVGLEAMAAGGLVFTGGTGEDYAVSGRNAIVLETLDPHEIVSHWNELAASPRLGTRLRRAARRTAREYAWREIAAILIDSLAHQARRQGLIASLSSSTTRLSASDAEERPRHSSHVHRNSAPAWRPSRRVDERQVLLMLA